MLLQETPHLLPDLEICELGCDELAGLTPQLEAFLIRHGTAPLSYHPAWLTVLNRGLKHHPFCLVARQDGQVRGYLSLAHLRSRLFGRFLVSLPYLNYGGVVSDSKHVSCLLIDRAVELAKRFDVRYLELRNETAVEHPQLTHQTTQKVHMRLDLPMSPEELWSRLPSKVRNQIRKGQKCGLTVAWGGEPLLPEFYDVFSRNMRDLGTPVYSRSLFLEMLRQFPDRVEICVIRDEAQTLATAILLHGWGVSEVPSASSLRRYNHTNANMLLYWNLLERSIQRGQTEFDFGRSTPDSNTFRFKKQWGANPASAVWQYHVRDGNMTDMRPDNPRYQRLIRLWQRMPVNLTRLIGPLIVRGIP
ncbi:FemAB-related protein, PEP-CTERM system-associated [Singulisphaera sp. GP187]|nr:FemAB-related protein, PEP-CTERM system-associated [Singulisphaera sp. GP187]